MPTIEPTGAVLGATARDVEVCWTHRWREIDSNHRSRDKRERCSEARPVPVRSRHSRLAARTPIATERLTIAVGTS
jgi:hypothetical protein